MADDNDDIGDDGGGGGNASSSPKKPLNKALLLTLANTLFIFAALGTLVYTKILFHKPVLTEQAELRKKEAQATQDPSPNNRPLVLFNELTVNIKTTSGKSHYSTVAFSVECRDSKTVSMVEDKRDVFIDSLITILGKKQITELNTIQGKLLLKTALMKTFNELTQPGAITNIYFSNFILQ